MKAQHIPGLSVAIALKGNLIWKEAFGYADLDNQVKVTTDSRFRVGSVSKSITSVALAKMKDEGKIDIEETVGHYLPVFAKKKYPVTLKQLAGHLGGIRHYKDNDPSDYIHQEHYTDVPSSLDIFKNDSLLFEPGTKYYYSSYGFVLLSAAMEKAAGHNFPDLMQKELFYPLHMTKTMPDYQDSIISGRTAYYQWSKEDQKVVRSPFEDLSYKWAGGGFLSTPTDLALMGSALLSGKFIKPATAELMMTSQQLKNGKNSGYGMGFRIGTDSKGRKIVHHGGVALGGRAFLLLYPDQNLVIAVTTNQGDAQFGERHLEKLANLFIE
ncbi:serine hydrolase domain-containing protein [Pedobacter rhodius]|uniref:Serine hydrolase n=1 Tax=Pedobacter rhodius TaxID=3004098 RepID=A0ABT4KWN1_9SPHI|nr:serine hydrolase domain-containing protein [Pedobacter sp. SJ11]MCZ4223346.1 serine hydrolase [Pedobacter sp. SJ11]